MLLDDDIFKFSLNDKLYTLQLTDNTEMKLKIKKGKKTYYIATKEELVNNLTSSQEYNNDNEIKIYYFIDDELIQLGVKENIIDLTIDVINFTTTNFSITDKVKISKLGSYIEPLNVQRTLDTVLYNKDNKDNFIIENALVTDRCIRFNTDDNSVSVEREVINYNSDTAFDFTSNDVLFNAYGSVRLKTYQSEYDYISLYYNNTDDFTVNNELDVVDNSLTLKSSQFTIERTTYTFDDVSNYTLTNVVQYGTNTGLVTIEPEVTT